MRRIIAVVALGLVTAACSTAEPAPVTTTGTTTTATTAPAAPSTTSTTILPAEDERTARAIGPEALGLMLPEELPEPWTSFSRQSATPIDNERAVTLAVQDLADEADDIATYGRVDGSRAVYVPRFGTGGVLAVEAWVDLFATDQGASGYLLDSVGDAAKRIDGGRIGSYVIDGAEDFAIDDVGTETAGTIITERSATGAPVVETMVGFRVGRMLGYVSVVRTDDGDARIAAQRLAETLRDRMLGVLDGSIVPRYADGAAVLASYAFSFEQRFSERYQITVFPEPSDEGDAGFEDDTTGSTAATSTTTTTSTTDPTAESTTTTTRIVTIDSTARVEAEGVVVGTDRSCDLTLVLAGGQTSRRYVATERRAWLDEGGGELVEVGPDVEPAVSDLLFCPGWPVLPGESGLTGIVAPGRGVPEDLDGLATERFDLDRDDLATVGLIPPGGAGIRLDEFTVWIVPEGPWIVGLDLSFRGTTEALEPAIGPGFYPGADVAISIEFRATRLGDPSLIVDVPASATR
jgi:hypothetical protein